MVGWILQPLTEMRNTLNKGAVGGEMRSSILAWLILRYILNTHLEMSRRQLNIYESREFRSEYRLERKTLGIISI